MISTQIDDDANWLIFELLIRLPVKSLLRFKSVCKRWCSFIQKDQHFINSYLSNRSKTTSLRRLLIVNPVPRPSTRKRKRNEYDDDESNEMFFWYDRHDNESYITANLTLFQQDNNNNKRGDTSGSTNVVMVDTVSQVDSTDYDIISNTVNGLMCLIRSRYKHAVRIFNITTRELSPWFQSSLLTKENGCWGLKNYSRAEPNYQFGFDHSTNEHKLVCLWQVTSSVLGQTFLICEVLTVGREGINGNNRWRRIEKVANVPYCLAEDSVHVNGVIYWSSFDFHNDTWYSKHRPVYLLAFDLRTEKFRTITVSDFIPDQIGDGIEGEFNPLCNYSYYIDYGVRVNLLEVSGRLALLVRMSNCLFKMYIYEDDDYKWEEEINRMPIGSGGSFPNNSAGRWSEASSITLPFNLGKRCGVRFCKFVGSDDEIIITSSEGRDCDKEARKKKCVSFYSYNWKKGSWREFEVGGNFSSFPHLCTKCFVTTFSESLLPVNNDKALLFE